jgi:protein TonB
VNLEIALDAEGRMTHARVLKTPHPDFLMNAVACARKWRFRPATKDGAPIAVTATMDVEFKLGR